MKKLILQGSQSRFLVLKHYIENVTDTRVNKKPGSISRKKTDTYTKLNKGAH